MSTDQNQRPVSDEEVPKAPVSVGRSPDSEAFPQQKSRRVSLGSVRRPLTDEELKSPAVQKILLDILEDAEQSRDEYKSYVDAFHGADKRAAVLGEKLNLDRSVEITFGVFTGLGGVILGFAPYVWGKDKLMGIFAIMIGFCLIIGASVARAVKR